MSIDLYPALDAGEIDVAVALERVSTAGRVAPLGAASLLYKNSDEHWPDDAGNDLSSLYPGSSCTNLATDGATIGEVFGEQLPQLDDSREPHAHHADDRRQRPAQRVRQSSAKGRCSRGSPPTSPRRTIFSSTSCAAGFRTRRSLTTVYDPSDGQARIPGVFDDVPELPLHVLDRTERSHSHARGAARRTCCSPTCYRHFLGHGMSARRKRIVGTGAGRSSSPTRGARARSGMCGWTRSTRRARLDHPGDTP